MNVGYVTSKRPQMCAKCQEIIMPNTLHGTVQNYSKRYCPKCSGLTPEKIERYNQLIGHAKVQNNKTFNCPDCKVDYPTDGPENVQFLSTDGTMRCKQCYNQFEEKNSSFD